MKTPDRSNYIFDQEYRAAHGITLLCGVDEAGRGPLAGPVCAAAVVLPPGVEIPGVTDSKKISEKRREVLFEEICEKALAFGIATASVEEIEELNILQADFLAMRRALAMLTVTPERILVDGNQLPPGLENGEPLVKGDAKSASVAAASILAKVSRDRYMLELDKQYPEYEFAKHKGYPTQLHYEKIKAHGISPVHRLSFLKNLSEHIKEK